MKISYKVKTEPDEDAGFVDIFFEPFTEEEMKNKEWKYFNDVNPVKEAEEALKRLKQPRGFNSYDSYVRKVHKNLLNAILTTDCGIVLNIRNFKTDEVVGIHSNFDRALVDLSKHGEILSIEENYVMEIVREE